MKEEVLAAVMFFARFIEKSDKFPQDQIENFKQYLTELLIQRFEKHWFPELPSRGQGYRCIRVNGVSPIDLTLERAASKCGSSYVDLRLPPELTVWVDPSEVCYRLGETEGSYCTLATFPSTDSLSSSNSSASSSENSTPINSPPTTPLQEKTRFKVQRSLHQRYPIEFSNHNNNNNNKYRNHSNMALQSFRVKSSPREMNFNYHHPTSRSMYRCDGPPFNMNPGFYRNINYNRPHKNVLRA